MKNSALVAALLCTFAGCDDLRRRFSDPPQASGAQAASASGAPILIARRDALRSGRAVVLDRRVTGAIADLGALLGQPACTVTAKPGHSTIACGAQIIAELPELPDLPALRDALGVIAKRGPALAAQDAATDDAWIAEGSAGLGRTRAAGQRWQKDEHTRAVVLDGLHGLLATLLAEHDTLELADAVSARALALLAIAERDGALPREAGLLAHLLGYKTAAAQLAVQLTPDDLLRDYLARDERFELRILADKKASPTALYLAHRVALEHRQNERAATLRARLPEALLAQSGVHTARLFDVRFREPLALTRLLPWLGVAEARALAGQALTMPPLKAATLEDQLGVTATEQAFAAATKLDPAMLIPELAKALVLINKDPGAFLAGDVVGAHFRALIGAADDALREGMLRQLGIPDISQAELKAFDASRPGAFAAGADWLRLAVKVARGTTPAATLLASLRKNAVFGAEPLQDLLQDFWRTGEWGDPVWGELALEIQRRSDSRPGHRFVLIYLARVRNDFVRRLELERSWDEIVGSPGSKISARVAIADGHPEKIRAQLMDTTASAMARKIAFAALKEAELATPADRQVRATLLLSESTDSAVNAASELLEKTDPKRAEQIASDWMRKHPGEMTLGRAALACTLARLQQARGDLAGAWKTIEPALQTGAGGPMMRAALIRMARGDTEGALAQAKERMGRYPSAKTIGLVVEILLRAGRVPEAAQLLARPPVKVTRIALMNEVGPNLVEALRDEAQVKAFVTALIPTGFDLPSLSNVANAFGKAGREDLAFLTVSLIPANGMQIVERASLAFPHLKAARGAAAAEAWVKQSVPPPMLQPFAIFVANEGEVDALFSVVPDPSEVNSNTDCVWLIRATALLLHRETSGPRWTRVLEHYQSGKGNSHYHTIGRHLTGLETEPAVIAVANDPRKASEAATYLGALAFSQGRIADAFDWFLVTLSGPTMQLTEFTLASTVTLGLALSHMSVDRLAKEGRWPQVKVATSKNSSPGDDDE